MTRQARIRYKGIDLSGLTAMQMEWLTEMIADPKANPEQVALTAGYSEKGIKVAVSKLIKHRTISKVLAKVMQARLERALITNEELQLIIDQSATRNASELFDERGRLKIAVSSDGKGCTIHDVPEPLQRDINGCKIKRRYFRTEDGDIDYEDHIDLILTPVNESRKLAAMIRGLIGILAQVNIQNNLQQTNNTIVSLEELAKSNRRERMTAEERIQLLEHQKEQENDG